MTKGLKAKTRVERPKRSPSRRAVLLLSGGVDSAVCLALLRKEGAKVESVFVDYGQHPRRAELESARRVASHFESTLAVVRISGFIVADGDIAARNLMLLACAANRALPRNRLVVIGVHAGTPYADCSPTFAKTVQEVLDVYSDGRVALWCPLLQFNKSQVFILADELGIDMTLLHSCERADTPCGKCPSCKDRRRWEQK